jgi:transposase
MGSYRLAISSSQECVLREHCAHAQAMTSFFAGTHGKPTWRKAGRNEGFRIVAVKPAHVIRIEDLKNRGMTRSARGTIGQPGRNVRQKAGLNREIMASGWGYLGRRLEDKAAGRVEKVRPQFTSQRCSACGHVDPGSRESQARFRCTTCGFACHADLNAAINIAAGHAVTARGGDGAARPANREPQHRGRPAA